MKRIKFIANLIKQANIVIDVGCDHCYLAIYLLENKHAKKVVNIDINNLPLQQGIINLKKKNFLSYTDNIVNDGLKDLHFEEIIDYVVISGLGSHTIIDILKNNKLKIRNFILQTNNKPEILRTFLVKNFFKIMSEYYIRDNKIIYVIFVVRKTWMFNFYSQQSIYFGNPRFINYDQNYNDFLNNRLQFLNKKIKITNVSKNLINEQRLLLKRKKYYECKGNL